MSNGTSPWGIDSIRLRLPGSAVVIEDLNENQRQAIARDYADFVVDREAPSPPADVVCRAGRLAAPLEASPDYFVVNDQYTLRKQRTGPEIKITGVDFLAHIPCRGPATAKAGLSTATEDALARVSVLENFLRVLLAYRVLDRGGVLLHSAGILYRDRAYLFCGRSGAGKTTLARKAAEGGAGVLSDDINLVLPENGGFRAHKVPFTGEFGCRAETLSGTGSFPLGGLVLLEKSPAVTAVRVNSADGVAGLLSGCPFVNDDPEELSGLLNVLMKLVAGTPVFRLGVGRDDSFQVVMDTLSRYHEDEQNNRD